ncbi:hypothetical protein EW146_g2925 [Bondarzewia mesenterica]|uniref:F-box domain-containing protein n=1 Tax=Bondarzewia mesenterica TaxID=1095465 RepID=A0A4S4LZ57_9AGAM|nr:hypothetical protein EW146_g2925 [Bondarzewia mesenterica]
MDSSQAPVLLTRVCREWRTLARSTPELWSSTVSIEGINFPASGGYVNGRSFAMLEDWLSLSRHRPLTFGYISHPHDPEVTRRILRILCAHVLRWKDVYLEIQGREMIPAPDIDSLPCLTKLEFLGSPDHTESWLPLLRRSSNLRTLLLDWWPEFELWAVPWPQLTALSIYLPSDFAASAFNLDQLVGNLSQCTNLETIDLNLGHCCAVIPAREPVLAPGLLELQIKVTTVGILEDFIRAFAAPKLESLTLCCEYDADGQDVSVAFLSFLSKSGWPSLRSLRLGGSGWREDKVVEILSSLPNITQLRLRSQSLNPEFLAPLNLRFSDNGQLQSGQNPHISSIIFDHGEKSSTKDPKALADMIKSRWHVPSNAFDSDGRTIRRLKEFRMSSYSLDPGKLKSFLCEQFQQIVDEGFTFLLIRSYAGQVVWSSLP